MKSLPMAQFEAVLYKRFVAAAALAAKYFGSTIAFITEQRMPDVFHVGTYLMGTARFKHTLHQRYIAEALYHAIVGDGRFPYFGVGWEHRHAQSVLRVTGDIAFNAYLVFGKITT